jgi:hypothetical protein
MSIPLELSLAADEAAKAHRDPLAAWWARVELLLPFVVSGEVSPEAGFDEIIDETLAIIGSAPNPCPICGDTPCRHDPVWCETVRKGQERRAAERGERAS